MQEAEVGDKHAAGLDSQIVEREGAVRRYAGNTAVLELHFGLAIAAGDQLHTRQQRQVQLCGYVLRVAGRVDSHCALHKGQPGGAGSGVSVRVGPRPIMARQKVKANKVRGKQDT